MALVVPAAIKYDPQLRGILIVLVGITILCGSVYMLLATNTGARLGFLLAAAGLLGWMTVLAFVWTIYGIGPKGAEPTWKVISLVRGIVGPTARPPLDRFPRGWKSLPDGDPGRAEAQASADEVLTGGTNPAAQVLGFQKTSDYLPVAAYEAGGEKYLLTLRHKPHYAVVQVQAVVTTTTTVPVATTGPPNPPAAPAGQAPGGTGTQGGQNTTASNQGAASARSVPQVAKAAKPTADKAKPVVTVLLERDLGTLRLPSFIVFVCCGVLFGIVVSVLHRRDKLAWSRREGEG